MEILPKKFGTRPQLAIEIRTGGVVAARAGGESSEEGIVGAAARAEFSAEAIEPGLKAGNVKSRAEVVAATRKTLEAVYEKGTGRAVTLVVPDAVVRVLLLDFDTLPTKASEAMPLVRFRLKKLLPFDTDEAQVSYQRMAVAGTHASAKTTATGGKEIVKVVAVAIPTAVLKEYEDLVRDAGFEPGAVLPSTLAALAGLEEGAGESALVVNAGPKSVTTAIVEGGALLLHRSVDLSGNVQVGILAETLAPGEAVLPVAPISTPLIPLVDREASQQEWAMQEAEAPFGRSRSQALAAVAAAAGRDMNDADVFDADRDAVGDGLVLVEATQTGEVPLAERREEVVQAVSVAAAYFEDVLERSPTVVLSSGSIGAERLGVVLHEAGFGVLSDVAGGSSAVRVKEIVGPEALGAQAASARVPASWLAGVRGALRS